MTRPETIVSALLTSLFVTVVVITNIPSASTQEDCDAGCRLPTFQYVQVLWINERVLWLSLILYSDELQNTDVYYVLQIAVILLSLKC